MKFYLAIVACLIFFACSATKKKSELNIINSNQQNVIVQEAELPEYIIEDELIVQFNRAIDLNEFTSKYSSYKLQIKEPIVSTMHMYLLTFDKERIKPLSMLSHIKADPLVKSASFNKQIESRN